MIQTKVFFIALLLNVLLYNTIYSLQPNGNLAGTITEFSNKQPIPGVNVIVEGTTIGTTTDTDGNFIIKNLAAGSHVIKISAIGFQTIYVPDVIINSSRTTTLNKSMHISNYKTGEVVVETGNYFETSDGVNTSMQKMNYEEIRRSPGSVGDVMRLAQTMPGVVISNDQRNDLIVRGGSPSENLIVIDNIEVPSINHYSSSNTSGGPISMLNTEFIDEALFQSGGFSSTYGERLSSMLNIGLREGNRQIFATDIEMGIAGFGLLSEGPLSGKGSYLISIRRSYLELLKDAIGLTAVPEYWNLNAKIAYDINAGNKIWFTSLSGIDQIDIKVDENDLEDPTLEGVDDEGWQTINGINWRHLWGKNGFATLTVSDALYYDGTQIYDRKLNDAKVYDQKNYEGTTTVKYVISQMVGKASALNYGTALKFYRLDYTIDQPYGYQNPFLIDSNRVNNHSVNEKFNTESYSAFVNYNTKLTDNFDVELGVRFDAYEFIEEQVFSPRLSLNYKLTDDFKVIGSVGRYYQQPQQIFLVSHPINKNLKAIKADQFVLGMNYFPRKDIKISMEGYYKEYSNYPVSTQYPALSMANTGNDFDLSTLLIPLDSKGSGRSYGIEFYVQKKLTDDLYGQISYSYTNTKHKALDGISRRASFDIPHIFNIIGGYKSGDWEFSTKFSFSSGRPYTPYLAAESAAQNRAIYDLSRINEEVSPSYQRLDLRVDKRFNFARWNLIFFVEILNVYNNENIQQYIWNGKTKTIDTIDQYAFLPNIGFNIKF